MHLMPDGAVSLQEAARVRRLLTSLKASAVDSELLFDSACWDPLSKMAKDLRCVSIVNLIGAPCFGDFLRLLSDYGGLLGGPLGPSGGLLGVSVLGDLL